MSTKRWGKRRSGHRPNRGPVWVSRLAQTVVIALCGFIGSGCLAPAVDQEVTGDYVVIAPDAASQAALATRNPDNPSSASVVVDAMVYEWGWNDSFIVAKQHPLLSDGWKVDSTITNWFIVEVQTEVVHGPMSEDEFNQMFSELGIPDTVSFPGPSSGPSSKSLPVPE